MVHSSKLFPSQLTLVHHERLGVPQDRNTDMLWGWILENERIHGTDAVVDILASTEFGRLIAERVNQIHSTLPNLRRSAADVSLDDIG